MTEQTKNLPFGKEYEREKLGRCLWRVTDHLFFFDCIQVIVNTTRRFGLQEEDIPIFAMDLKKSLVKHLKCKDGEVQYYTAVDSPLDRYHGVDCFFIWWEGKDRSKGKIVTIDITSKKFKSEFKADFLITRESLAEEEAQKIAKFLREGPDRIFYQMY